MTAAAETLWEPSAARIAQSNMTAFERAWGAHCRCTFSDYRQWHARSVAQPAEFWHFYLRYSNLPVTQGEEVAVLNDAPMPATRWFEGASVNYAQALLHPPAAAEEVGAQTALLALHENGRHRTLSYDDLRAEVAACTAALAASGVCRGDRVAAFMGNVPETVILLCACAAMGAVFSSCSPDFGEQAALARFSIIRPRLLFAQPAYSYQGKRYNVLETIGRLAAATAGADKTIFVADGEEDAIAKTLPPAQCWRQWIKQGAGAAPYFAALPFDHPLYILYSSGTTGLPKAIVHRGGGVMLKHHSEHHLHSDIRRGDRVFYFTTCGWMMWNWLVSALMQAATVVLYEGSPAYPTNDVLWRLAQQHGITFFGTSARFIQSNAAAGAAPRRQVSLPALRTVASTGSPLSPAGFEWVYQEVKSDVHLASISGGSDIVGCFLLGNPNLPVVAGQLQVPAAGVDVAAADAAGNAVVDAPGELISRVPHPSMPLKFWGDEDYQRYRAAYFAHYPGVWRHGDLITMTAGGGAIVHGRSDATLNPGGVRLGSADIYRPLARLAVIADMAAVGKKTSDDEEIWLFVVLQDKAALDEELQARIKSVIARAASPRHVPRRIMAVSALPRTHNGKVMELAISDVINGREVKNRSAVANPQALEEIAALLPPRSPA